MDFSERFWSELYDAGEPEIRELLGRLARKHPDGGKGLWPIALEAWGTPDDTDGTKEPPRLVQINDLAASVGEPPAPLAGPQLPDRKLLALSASPKEGKTYLALEIARAVSTGEPLFGVWDVPQAGTVVYLDMENGDTEMVSRMTRRGDLAQRPPWYICTQQFDISTAEGRAVFEGLLAGLPSTPRLVIIDTLREAFRVKDWNNDAQVLPLLTPWREWAHTNCTVLCLHHNNKNSMAQGADRMSGTTAIAGATDGMWLMANGRRQDNGNRRWQVEVRGRGGMQGEIMLELDTETLRVQIVDAETVKAEQSARTAEKRSTNHEKALRLIEAASAGMTAEEMSAAGGMGVKWCRMILKEMLDAGLIRANGSRQIEGRGVRPAVYVLETQGRL